MLTSRGLPASRFGLAHSFVEKSHCRYWRLVIQGVPNFPSPTNPMILITGSRAQNLFLTNFYNYFLGAAFKKSHGIFRE